MNNRFDNLSAEERCLLFEALVHCIRSNSGIGFHGYDQGDMVYAIGSKEPERKQEEDGPDSNAFFQMYRELSLHVIDDPSVGTLRQFCATDWQSFCQLALRFQDRKGIPPFPHE
jgi:hypothetical protein